MFLVSFFVYSYLNIIVFSVCSHCICYMIDLQERKMELYQAILKLEENGSADESIQVRSTHAEPVESI